MPRSALLPRSSASASVVALSVRVPVDAAFATVAMDPPAPGAPGIRELLRRLESCADGGYFDAACEPATEHCKARDAATRTARGS